MANRWKLTDELKAKFIPIVKNYLNFVENITEEQCEKLSNEDVSLELSDMGINPYQLETLFNEIGYEELSLDNNGWELDFWIRLRRKDKKSFVSGCEQLIIRGCGMTFELKVCIDGFDF